MKATAAARWTVVLWATLLIGPFVEANSVTDIEKACVLTCPNGKRVV